MGRGHVIIEEVFNVRYFDLVLFFLIIPSSSQDDGALVHSSADELINETHLVDLSIELVIENQSILKGSLLVFPSDRFHIEELTGTEEWLTQSRVSPLCLFTNELWYHRRVVFACVDLGFASAIQVIQPLFDLTHLC